VEELHDAIFGPSVMDDLRAGIDADLRGQRETVVYARVAVSMSGDPDSLDAQIAA